MRYGNRNTLRTYAFSYRVPSGIVITTFVDIDSKPEVKPYCFPTAKITFAKWIS